MQNLAKLHKNEKGQTLLFVVVAMTIALSIGINASVRTLSSLSRTSRTDTASRALAAAEGGIERYLALSTNDLEASVRWIDEGSGGCPEGTKHKESDNPTNRFCLIEFEDASGSDVLVSQAYVKVERYTPDYYPFHLESGQLKEVSLQNDDIPEAYGDNQIIICWTPDSNSDVMYTSYDSDGILKRGGLTGSDSPTTVGYEQLGFDDASEPEPGSEGYVNCKTVEIADSAGDAIYGLRIRSVGGASDVAVYPTSGNSLPLQGYRIESIGKISQDQAVTASRAVRVVRTLPYLPASFDYALYSQGGFSK